MAGLVFARLFTCPFSDIERDGNEGSLELMGMRQAIEKVEMRIGKCKM